MRGAAFAAALLVTIGGQGLGGAAPEPSDAAWRQKAEPLLLAAYDAGEALLRVEVQGLALPGPAAQPQDRMAWRAFWTEAAAPFLAAMRAAAARVGGELTTEVPAINAAFVHLPRDGLPGLLSRPEVRRASLDWVGAMGIQDPEPGGPGVQVSLGNAGALIQVPELWTLGFRGEGVTVAVLDTGVRSTHEMMRNADGSTRVALWKDFSSNNCANPCDGNGHGTHTTTTAVGSNLFNGASPQGMAPRATVFHGKVLDNGGSGAWEWGQEGLQWAFDNGADLTSNSWSGGCGGGAITTGELAEELADAGMTSFFSAGNAGPGPGSVNCPAAAEKVVAVGAVDINENIASFSSRGPCTWHGKARICPDVQGMGVNLEAGWSTSDTAYASVSGTSMSTPGVAGMAALLQQASKALRGKGLDAANQEMEVLLRHTAKDLGLGGIDNDYGWGLAKGKVAHDKLAATPALALRDVTTFAPAELHGGQSSILTFSVAELGSVVAAGHFRHEVRQLDFGSCPPACEVVVAADRDVTLAQAQEAISSYQFSGAEHAPGNYLVEGTFDYTYTDPADGQLKAGSIARSANFLLKRVVWQAAQSLPASAHTGDVVHGSIALVNVGNEAARDLEVQEEYRAQGFAPVPLVPPGTGPLGALADPAPSDVGTASGNTGTVRYEWAAGDIAAGGAWDARFDLAATQPGTYVFRTRLTYEDETGTTFTLQLTQNVPVTLPV